MSKALGRVVFISEDGIPQIRMYNKEKDIIEQIVQWPNGWLNFGGTTGKFAGFTPNGYLKYKYIDGNCIVGDNLKEL